MEFLIKTIIGGIIIATVSSVSQKYPTIGAFVLGIPLASIVSFIFLYGSKTSISLNKFLQNMKVKSHIFFQAIQ